MTISSEINRVSLAGNGVTTDIPFPYLVLAAADLYVVETIVATGVQATKALTTDYTVIGSPDSGGHYPSGCTVRANSAWATGRTWTVINDPALTQLVDPTEGDNLPVDDQIERPLDRLTVICQRLASLINRTLRQPDGDIATIGEMLPKATRASTILGFDANGDPMAASTGVPATAFMASVLDDATALAARTTLNVEKTTYVGNAGGTVNAITLTSPEPITAYAAGQRFVFKPLGINTNNVTVAVDGLAAKSLGKKGQGALGSLELTPGDLGNATGLVEIIYDGTLFFLTTPPHGAEGSWYVPSVGGNATYTSRNCRVWRHGRLAVVEVQMTIDVLGTGSPIQISGLPVPLYGNVVAPVIFNNAANNLINCNAIIAGGIASLYSIAAAGVTMDSSIDVMGNGTTIYFTAAYMTSD